MIGLIGCGRWGSKILRDLRALGRDVGVVARSDGSIGRAREGGASTIWESIDAMGDVEGIIVATPTSTHADIVAGVLDRDVPIFSEKPIGMDVGSVRGLVERGAGRVFVMHKWRYHRGIERLRELATSREYGRLQRLRVDFESQPRRYADADGAWTLLPHVLSIVLEIVGGIPEFEHASGWRDQTGEVDIVATLADGGVSTAVSVSTGRPTHRREVTAIFSDATVALSGGYAESLSVRRHGEPAETAPLPFEAAMPLFDELAAFVGHLEGGPRPRSSIEEGLEIVETILEIRERLGWGAR